MKFFDENYSQEIPTRSYSLDEIDQAYKDMDERKTIKAMIVIE